MRNDEVHIVLASASPRRRRLLEDAGFRVEVRATPVDEKSVRAPTAAGLVMARAKLKAEATARAGVDGGYVVAADTAVVLEGEVLGKPRDEADARAMLARLSGRTHQVLTGVALRPTRSVDREPDGLAPTASGGGKSFDGGTLTAWAATDVTMGVLSPEVIAAYVATGEPLDKAGAYGIQGRGGLLVARLAGDYFNVVGLPLFLLREMFHAFGVELMG